MRAKGLEQGSKEDEVFSMTKQMQERKNEKARNKDAERWEYRGEKQGVLTQNKDGGRAEWLNTTATHQINNLKHLRRQDAGEEEKCSEARLWCRDTMAELENNASSPSG